MSEFTPLSGFIGGLLIGLASVLLLLGTGRIAGISGIYSGLLTPAKGDWAWRLLFVSGLLLGGAMWPWLTGKALPVDLQAGWPVLLLAGFLVGFGTRLGNGCTSGHGVCGIGRLAPRSMIATLTFMTVAGITTFVMRHLIGG